MEEKVLYYSSLCPDTIPFKKTMSELGIGAREVNITENMRNLKEFLLLRDTEGVFRPRKEKGMVGIPCLVTEDGEFIFEVARLVEKFGTL